MRESRPCWDKNPVEQFLNAPPRTAQLRAPRDHSAILSVVAWPPFGDLRRSCHCFLRELPVTTMTTWSPSLRRRSGLGRLPLPCTLPGNPNLRIEDQLPRTGYELDVPFKSALGAMEDVLRLDAEIETIQEIAAMNDLA